MDNSLEAFIHAQKCQLDGVELDIYMTCDGIPFILHESGNMEGYANLYHLGKNCMENVQLSILTYDQLQEYRLANKETKIPTLSQVLEVFRESQIEIFLDFKN